VIRADWGNPHKNTAIPSRFAPSGYTRAFGRAVCALQRVVFRHALSLEATGIYSLDLALALDAVLELYCYVKIWAGTSESIPQGLKPRIVAGERDPRLKPWAT
jgi:hypothetical protein